MFIHAFLAAAALLTSQVSLAWGSLGHQLVCDIAWREMAKQTREEVDKLVEGSRYRTFAQACNWPDHIKRDDSKDWLKPYHYINVPRDAVDVQQEHCADRGCVLSGIERFSRAFDYAKTKQNTGSKPGSKKNHGTKQNQREALFLVGHLIGDIHQPMHVSYEDDLGGNKVRLEYEGERTNLHRLWDSDILKSRYGKRADWRTIGKRLHEEAQQEFTDQQLRTEPLQWANESRRITANIYDELPDTRVIDTGYVEKNYPVMEMRLKLAGMRLARYLDGLVQH